MIIEKGIEVDSQNCKRKIRYGWVNGSLFRLPHEGRPIKKITFRQVKSRDYPTMFIGHRSRGKRWVEENTKVVNWDLRGFIPEDFNV